MEDSNFDKFNLFLSNFDFFGLKMSFLYKGRTKYKTCYGGVITVLCSILLTFIFISISSDCFYKLNPFVREAILYDQKSILQGNDFFFGLYFTDEDDNIIQNFDKYLSVIGVIKNNTSTISKEENTFIPFKKCDSKYFANYDTSRVKLKDIHCLDIQDKFILMNGYNEFPKISLSINIDICVNKTLNNKGKFLFYFI